MSLLPFLFEYGCPQRNRVSSLFTPETVLYTIKNVLDNLAQVETDNSTVINKNQFQASIDVQHFKPEEISVKLSGNTTVTVEGKHEEKQDEHGSISRHFVRRYELPDDCDVQKLQSKLSSDGVLSVTVPKKPKMKKGEYKQIPITRTGPVQSMNQKPKDEPKGK